MANTLVQSATGAASGIDTVTATFGAPVSKGDLIVLIWGAFFANFGASSVTDSLGNVYSLAADNSGVETSQLQIWFAVANADGAVTVSVQASGASVHSLICLEYSGLIGPLLDQNAVNRENVAATITTGSITTHQTEIIVAGALDATQEPVTWAITAGFTVEERVQNPGGAVHPISLGGADAPNAVGGAYNPTFSGAEIVGGDALLAAITSFRDTPAGLVKVTLMGVTRVAVE